MRRSLKKRAFTLLEVIVCIAIIAMLSGLVISDFKSYMGIGKRPPQVVMLESFKRAKLLAYERGEQIELSFDEESQCFIFRSFATKEEIERVNIFSKSEKEMKNESDNLLGDIKPKTKVEFIIYPIYPKLYNTTNPEFEGLEKLSSIKFHTNSAMTPVYVELKVADSTVAECELDVFTGSPKRESKYKKDERRLEE